MSNAVSLYVGDDYRVAGLLQGRITYAGMPSSNVFSLVHKRDIGAQYAYNLFFAVDARDISIGGTKIHVLSVASDKIILEVENP